MRTCMSPRACAAAFLVLAGQSLAQTTPTVGAIQVIDPGPVGKVVNEPNVIAALINEEPVLLAIWQVGDAPVGSEVENPEKLMYSIGAVDPVTRIITWGLPADVPMPGTPEWAADPALAAIFAQSGGFVASGIRAIAPLDDTFAFSARTNAQTGGTILQNPQALDSVQVRSVRMGSFTALTNDTSVLLIGTSVDPAQNFGRLFVRQSSDNGVTWSNWSLVTDNNNQQVEGFASRAAWLRLNQLAAAVMDERATFVKVFDIQPSATTVPFVNTGLSASPNLVVPGGQTYFTVAKNYVAGAFQLGPFPDLAYFKSKPSTANAYVVYHDIVGSQGSDADFDIYFAKGDLDIATGAWTWSMPTPIINDSTDQRSDQFMPTITVDPTGRIHMAYYDTRHDLRSPGQAVKIALYYAYSDDPAQGFTEILVDDQAISTSALHNPKSIGDRIDITPIPGVDSVVITYLGTQHPRFVPPGGMNGLGGPVIAQTDEAIFSCRIDF